MFLGRDAIELMSLINEAREEFMQRSSIPLGFVPVGTSVILCSLM